MTNWVKICEVGDVPVGQIRAFKVTVLSFPILVAHVGERYLASTSICPHEEVSLIGGDLQGTVLTCPAHAYEFDLTTGRCSHDAGLRLRRFPVRLSCGSVYVQIDLHRRGV